MQNLLATYPRTVKVIKFFWQLFIYLLIVAFKLIKLSLRIFLFLASCQPEYDYREHTNDPVWGDYVFFRHYRKRDVF